VRESKSKTPHPKDNWKMIEEEKSYIDQKNSHHNYSSSLQNKTLVAHSELSKMLRLNLQSVVPSNDMKQVKPFIRKEQNSLPNIDQQSLSGDGSCSGGAPHKNNKNLNLTDLSNSTLPYKKDTSITTDEDNA
jgi:hypothetical protein